VLTKERSTGTYRLSAYFVGKVLAETPLELVMPILFSVITYWMVGLADDGGSFVFFVVIMCLFVLMGSGIGLLIGAIMVDVKKALTLSTIVVLGSVLLGTRAPPPAHTYDMHADDNKFCLALCCCVVLQAGSSSARTT
jgi:ABC-type multidrug transport system permease subunit